MQITSLDYSSFLGRIAVGRVARGVIKEGENMIIDASRWNQQA
jgi:GTP-binding protein